MCGRGTYSKTGVEPCFPCTFGFFQPKAGQSSCIQCPDAKSTLAEGAVQSSECRGLLFTFVLVSLFCLFLCLFVLLLRCHKCLSPDTCNLYQDYSIFKVCYEYPVNQLILYFEIHNF